MKHFFLTRLLACLAVLLGLWPTVAAAVPFTPGNIVVVRVGDGSTVTAAGAAAATFLLEYTPAGVLVQTIALPTAPVGSNSILTNTASSSSDALLTRSVNGAYLVLTGYDAAVGTAGLTNTASTANNRIIGRVAADGTVDTSTRLGDAFSGTTSSGANIRSATSVDGASFYAVGSNTGVRYVPFGNSGTTATTAISTAAPTNLRGINIFGGNLYVSSASGTFQGISQVGTGLPTTGPQTITALPGFPTATGPQPYAFYAADLSTAVTGIDVMYVADDRTAVEGGIQKWSLVAGTWTFNGTMAASPAVAIRGLDGKTTGTSVSLVASGNGGLYLVADNAGYNVAPTTTTLTALVPAPGTNAVFRGAAFAPVAIASVPTITSFTPTSGAAGTTVTVTGTNLTGATAVTLNGAAITGFTVVNGTTITFTVPTTATSGTIAVTTPGGSATSTGTFTFVPAASAPVVTSFTPTSGLAGTAVIVTGTGFTGATSVTLNGVAVTTFTVGSPTQITFIVPTGATSGPVCVTTPSGSGCSSGSFTVSPPVAAPTITSLTPTAQVVGGPAVTLTIAGTGFTPTTTVSFNGVTYTQTSSTATSLVVTIPASAVAAVGSFPVTVTNTAGTSTAFTFVVSNPSTAGAFENFETGVKTGYAAAPVTLTSGIWNFSNALLGASFADKFNGLQSARIRTGGFIAMNFDKPNGAGVVTINAALYGTTDTGATFVLEQSTDGGTTYTPIAGAPAALTGTLTPYTFTVNQAGNVRFRISNSVTVTTNAFPRIIIDDISIADFGAPTNPVPVVTSYTPTTAQSGTSVTITITGTGFTPASTIVASNPALPGGQQIFTPTFVSATQLTLTLSGSTLPGTYSVVVVNPTPGGGSSNAVTFTITPAVVVPTPTITSFTPTSGGPGTIVTITGTNFTGATTVTIGAFNVPNFTVVSATSITFVVPNGTGSVSGRITVATPGGTALSTGSFNVVSATLASQALPGLLVYPNPATDRLTVALPTSGAATVALRDLTGRLVLASAPLAADQQLRLPAGLAAGIYLLEVRQGDVTAVRRIEKN